tara:strand:+ start:770 stop:1279 length:510 start_codon:yes stop_codon:yes gene_type:complete
MKIDLKEVEFKVEEAPLKELVPPGNYVAEIIDSQEKISKAGNSYLSLKLSICEGPYEGRWIWDNLNINHPDEKVRGTARFILGNICKAAGLVGIDDTSELHYKPLTIELDEEPEGDYPAKNVVRKYHKASTSDPAEKNKKALKELDNMPIKQVDVSDKPDAPVNDNIPF